MNAIEVGLQVITKLGALPILDEQRGHVRFPRCPFCRRRPELVESKGSWLNFRTGLIGQNLPDVISVPRYEILPCCSARYTKLIEHVTRKQKLQAQALIEMRTA